MPVNSFENYPMAWKPEKSKLPRPIYKSLAEQMEKDIAEGLLLPGTKLPPQRELAEFLDINFTTVTRAYKLCEYKGLIQSVMGSGTFVAAHANQSTPLAKDIYRHNVIEMGPISSFEETNDLVVPLLHKVLDHMYPEQFLTYRDPAGMAHQRQAGAEWLSLLGVKVKYTEVVIMTGAQNALTTALLTLFNPGDRIAVDTFTFMNFIELSKLYHLTLVPVPGDENGMSAEELDNVCNQSHVSGVFLIPSCHNPTTIVMNEERKKDIAAVIKKHDLLLIEDDADAFMTYGYVDDCGEPLHSMIPERTVYVCSMSKSLCSGLRIALMVVPPNTEAAFERSIFNTNVKTSSMDAEVISEAIISGAAHKIVEHRIQLAKEANEIFNEVFYGRNDLKDADQKRAQKKGQTISQQLDRQIDRNIEQEMDLNNEQKMDRNIDRKKDLNKEQKMGQNIDQKMGRNIEQKKGLMNDHNKKPSQQKASDNLSGNLSDKIQFSTIPRLSNGGHPFPYYRWLPIKTNESPEAVQARLLAKGVNVFTSASFRADSKATEKFLRISLSSTGSMEMLRKGLTIIKEEI